MSQRPASRPTRTQRSERSMPSKKPVVARDESDEDYATADEGSDSEEMRVVINCTIPLQHRSRQHAAAHSQRLVRTNSLPPHKLPPMVPTAVPTVPRVQHRPTEAHQPVKPASDLSVPLLLRKVDPSRVVKPTTVGTIPFPTQSRGRQEQHDTRRPGNVNKPLPRSPSPGKRRLSFESTASYSSLDTQSPGLTPDRKRVLVSEYNNCIQSARESMEALALGRKPQYTLTDPNLPFYDTKVKIRQSEAFEKAREILQDTKKQAKKVGERVRRNSLDVYNGVYDAGWEVKLAARSAKKEVKKTVGGLARRVSQEFQRGSMELRRVISRDSFGLSKVRRASNDSRATPSAE